MVCLRWHHFSLHHIGLLSDEQIVYWSSTLANRSPKRIFFQICRRAKESSIVETVITATFARLTSAYSWLPEILKCLWRTDPTATAVHGKRYSYTISVVIVVNAIVAIMAA